MLRKVGLLAAFVFAAGGGCTGSQSTPPAATPLPGTPEVAMVSVVPAGQQAVFQMGSSDAEIAAAADVKKDSSYYTDDEQPLHQVTLTVPYSVGKYEVTNAQYCAVLNWAIDNGKAKVGSTQLTDATGTFPYLSLTTGLGGGLDQVGIQVQDGHIQPAPGRSQHPVDNVTWYGTVAFANFLSEMSGLEPVYDLTTWKWDTSKNGYRLPTEAEWEYAARGTTRHVYAWGDQIDDTYLAFGDTYPVGSFNGSTYNGIQTHSNASPFGAYDMTGSVWEWVWDFYGRSYYAHSPATDPLGPETGDDRPPFNVGTATHTWRGCGWNTQLGWGYLRVAKRWSSAPNKTHGEVGFRLARTTR